MSTHRPVNHGPPRPPDDRLFQLLADQAMHGLSPSESAELDALLAGARDENPDSFALAAAALDLALAGSTIEPMPDALRERIEADAERRVRPSASAPPLNLVRPKPADAPSRRPMPVIGRLGWVAAAACLTLALVAWWPTPDATPAQSRAALLAGAPDAIEVPWTPWDPAGGGAGAAIQGDIVWSDARQAGFMRFRGLPANDPAQQQYQLWIIDAERPGEPPVDGGLFNIEPGQTEVILPIHPPIKVGAPAAFAVTIEKPGGVVVSDLSRKVVIAPTKG